jgi:two-component system sensor histidine kinase HydH
MKMWNGKKVESSPWLMAGLALILGLAVLVFAVRNVQRTKAHMIRSYLEHAEALTWALEAGTRIGMGRHGGSGYFQSLVEETAKQHGIVYLAVTDCQGRILAHDDAIRIGSPQHELQDMAALGVRAEGQGRFRTVADGEQVFEVYKNFTPMPGARRAAWCGGMGVNGHGPCGLGQSGHGGSESEGAVIFVGLDTGPLNAAVAAEVRTSAIIGGLVVLMGLAGFTSLFWAQHYRLSRRQLRDTQAFASEVVTCLPLGLVTTDPDGRIVLANAQAARLLGLEGQDLAGQELRALGGLDWDRVVRDLAETGAVLERETNLDFGTDRQTPIGLGASRIVTGEGQVLGHLFLLRDMAELRRLQEQVRRDERLAALGNLAAGVAHEIRNPLSSIKGFATYLAGKVQGADQEAARAMVQETDRLNRVVSELLEFARPTRMRFADTDVNQVVERTLRLIRADAEAKSLSVVFVPDPSLPLVRLDAERLGQALLNLFLNAVQAMDTGGVLRVAADVGGGRLVLRVIDTGRGMAAALLPDIFNPYFTTKPSGTGLGLAIVHRIVEAHGGEVAVQSQVGQGTVFTLSFPLAPEHP